MKLLLIAGHGGTDPGAGSIIGGVDYSERAENMKVVAAVFQFLQGYADVTVYPTDRNAYEDYQRGSLVTVAQFSKYDYVLEVHFNAFVPDSGDGNVKGCEVLVRYGQTDNAFPEKIIENLGKLGLDRGRGVKSSSVAVIGKANEAGTSACLLEVCFVDDADDMAIYVPNRERVAAAIANAVISHFGLTKEVVPNWYDEAMAYCAERGLINDGRPGDVVTRAELATILMRLGV